MSQLLLTTFPFLNLAGVCPNSFVNDFISWKTKLYIGFFAVLPIYRFIFLLREYYNTHEDIAAFILILGNLCTWINFLLIILTPTLNPSSIVKFFKIIDEAQKTFNSLKIALPALPSKKTQLWYIGMFGVLPVVAAIVMRAPYASAFNLYWFASSTTILVVNFAALLKIKCMLLLLDSMFEILNNRFKIVCDETMSISSKTDFDVDKFLFKLNSIKYVKPKNRGSGITVHQILKFNQAHFQLCDAHKIIESMFSFTALSETLFVCFYLTMAFTSTISKDLLGEIYLYYASFLMMFLFISVLSSATDVKNNSLKTGYLVHELLNEELPLEVEEELQLFSRSLCLRKIGISAQGFFMVDLKLLTKMVCTLAPLILIMVQRKHRAMRANTIINQ